MTTCWYRDCPSLRRYPVSLVFFTVPKDAERRAKWTERCGFLPDSLPPNTIRHICERHFEPSHIRRQFYRTTLSPNALPIKWTATNQKDDNDWCQQLSPALHPIHSITNRNNVPKTNDDPEVIDREEKHADDNYVVEELDDLSSLHEVEIVDDPRDENDETSDFDENNRANEIRSYNHDNKQCVLMEDDILSGLEYSVVVKEEHVRHNDDDHDTIKDDLQNGCDTTTLIDIAPPAAVPYPCSQALERRQQKRIRAQIQHNKQHQRLLSQKRRRRHAPNLCQKAAPPQRPTTTAASIISAPVLQPQGDPEDTYFALSLVGSLQRLRPQQRAMAKMNIVRYLTEMAFTDTASL